ncbi:U3 small nucleolar ribonucleoprotein protein IMP4 isoform X1 [Capsella rubella]|nr:U3 small nucleolar ribonucleoprotein protein IMP4 isoform X1 [Capsella rubella]
MVMKNRAAEEEEPEKKIRLELMNLDKEKIWGEFESVEMNRILSGETKPKILITTCQPVVARELIAVFPNSEHLDTSTKPDVHEMIEFAKDKGFTALIVTDTGRHAKSCRQAVICIMSLVNGAAAYFEFKDFLPRNFVPYVVDPPSSLDPFINTTGFTSPLDVGTERLIRSLFPLVPSPSDPMVTSTNERCTVSFVNFPKDDAIHFINNIFYCSRGTDGKLSSVHTSQECGPQFSLKLLALEKITPRD